jgi:hypothetical protein
MDQHWNLGAREDLGRLTAGDDYGEAVAAMRGYDD